MTTSSFSIDKEIRDMAARRAKADRISVSAVARMLLRDYAEGRIGIGSLMTPESSSHTQVVEVDEETRCLMENVATVWKERRAACKA